MKTRGETTIVVQSVRRASDAAAPCSGYMTYYEPGGDESGAHAPYAFALVEKALGDQPEFGSIVRIHVTVEVVKAGIPSRKKCHNPWPAHRHDHEKKARK